SIVSYAWTFGDGATSTEANPSHMYATAGTYTVSLTVTDAEGLSDVETIQLEVFEPSPEYDFSLHINAGSSQTVSYDGKEFVGDETINPIPYANARKDYQPLASSNELFRSARSSTSISTGGIVYTIDVPNGVYKVSTYHIEQHFGIVGPGVSGARRFNIRVEGENRQTGVDLYATGQNNPVKFEFENIIVLDGKLNLEINPTLSRSIISGISIEGFVSLGEAALRVESGSIPTILASPMEGDGPLKVDFMGDLTGVDQGNLTYSYDFGNGTTSTEKNPSHVFMSSGTHDVKITVKDGKNIITQEKLTILVNKSNETGFNSESGFGKTSINMYPNPASSFVNLQPTDSSIKIAEIGIFDIRGRLIQKYEPGMVENGNKYTIKVDDLAAGVYLVTTTTESGATQMHRLIVE
ncbi:PKD domain-containing protein, partial [Algoriphagus antarcticus]